MIYIILLFVYYYIYTYTLRDKGANYGPSKRIEYADPIHLNLLLGNQNLRSDLLDAI